MDELVHGFYLVERKFGIEGVHNSGNALGHASGIAESTHRKARRWPRGLPEGNIDFRESFAADAAVMNITVDADNLPFNGRAEFRNTRNELLNDNALRQRIHLGQILLGEGLIHDRDGQAASDVLFGKSAALKHA